METEKIISTLKEKIGTTSLSDRTISDYVRNNLLAEGLEPDASYFEKHTNILKSLNGNFNADVAARVGDFKNNYKPAQEPSGAGDGPKNDFELRLKAIEEASNKKFEALKSELEKKDKALLQKNYVSQLEGKFKAGLEEKGLIYDPIYFEHIVSANGEFDTTKSIDDAVQSISEKYDKLFKDRSRQITSNGFIYGSTSSEDEGPGAGASGMTSAEAFKARMRDEGYLPNTDNNV